MIVLTGFNSSGTTAIVKLLVTLGIPFPGPYDHERNYEHKFGRLLNDIIINRLARLPPQGVGPLLFDDIPPYDTLRNYRTEKIAEFPDINWKDPKLMIMLPVWHNKIDRLIWVKRSIHNTIKSQLNEFRWFSWTELTQVIRKYDERLSRALDEFDVPHIIISYESFYRDRDITEAKRLLAFCGVDRPADRIEKALDGLRQPRND